ncbi:polyamine deacetylase HDAC10 isoform X1 [Huso huso]|uniref:Polyamine deacetylase HDAC10 isoform X1 n=1 Tax=Huso huso TaxID=61971 RepID=A0ABR0ZCW1_HUSHU
MVISKTNENGAVSFEQLLIGEDTDAGLTRNCFEMASGSALIYDEEMTQYKLLWDYPECSIEVPERLCVSHTALKSQGLLERCVSLPVREATEEEILLAHSAEYLAAVKTTPSMNLEELQAFSLQYEAVYFHQNIYHCAKLALGATLQLVDSVMTGKVRNGMALVRPPGHHSQHSAANGFCVFNNVAVAAHYAKRNYNLTRVLIVDWDVHHGQGIQYSFEDDPSVLYFSWHRYEHQQFWPNLHESDYNAVGKGKGTGFNINLPWNKVGMDNADYLAAFFHVLLPVAYEFSPELVLISAGFDSAVGDPEGHMSATPQCFAHLTHLLMSLAGGKLCACLNPSLPPVFRGGYNLDSLSQSVCQTMRALLGDPAPPLSGLAAPCVSAVESIQNVRAAHQQYWGCLSQDLLPVSEPSTKRLREGGEEEESNGQSAVESAQAPPAAPPMRTAIATPAGQERSSLEQSLRVEGSPATLEQAARCIRGAALKSLEDEKVLCSLGNLFAVLDKIMKKEVRNGLAVVPDLPTAAACAAGHAINSETDRVLVVFLGDEEVYCTSQHCNQQFLQGSSLCVSVLLCVPLQESETRGGLLQVLFTLVLPVAYGFGPGLVVTALGGWGLSGAHQPDWQRACLSLITLNACIDSKTSPSTQQDSEAQAVGPIGSSLLGDPAPVLGPQPAPSREDAREVERQRQRLQQHWGLVQAAGEERSHAAAGEERSHAAAGEERSHAAAGEERSHAAAGEERSQAAAGEERSHAAAGEERSHAAAGEERSRAAAGEERSHAAA